MLAQLRPALAMLLLMTVLTGFVYPAAVTGVAQLVFPFHANGSLLERDGKTLGSALIGQAFADPQTFLVAAIRDLALSLQRKLVERFQPGADQPGADRRGKRPRQGATRRRSRKSGENSGRPDNRFRQRPRPTHQRGRGRVSGKSSGKGARSRPASVRALIVDCTEGRQLGFLGEPGSTCCVLTWRWTGCIEKGDHVETMNLVGRYFSAHDIQLGVEASDKLTALASAAVLAESRYQIDRAQVERALWRREQTGTTAIGHGIAIPHARIAGISKPIVLFLRTGKPVKFAAPDRKPVDNLLVILVPNYATRNTCAYWPRFRPCSQTPRFAGSWPPPAMQLRSTGCSATGRWNERVTLRRGGSSGLPGADFMQEWRS